jgi:hypothetical protein
MTRPLMLKQLVVGAIMTALLGGGIVKLLRLRRSSGKRVVVPEYS